MSRSSPAISVVVPFYNVERYAPYCLRSLAEQDFEDYQVICVDDGSTDKTGSLLDEWANRDVRFQVLHKKNGGLSDARNKGIERSAGRLITFVDGDDIVSPYYLSTLYRAMEGKEKRIVIGKFQSVSFSRVEKGEIAWSADASSCEASREETVRMLLYDKLQPSACAKLAPREIYERTPFPLGVRYEEIRTVLNFLLSVNSYAICESAIYGYVMRKGSITWSKEANPHQLLEYREAIDIICGKAGELFPRLRDACVYQRALLDVRAHSQLPVGARRDAAVRKIDNAIIQELRHLIPSVLTDLNVSNAAKIRFALLAYAPQLYDLLYQIYKRRAKGVA